VAVAIDPMRIEITPRTQVEGYKSIHTLTWDNIPGLAILTGRNGSGKTHLLELLSHHFSGTFPPTLNQQQHLPVHINVSGTQIADDQVGYVPSTGRFGGGSSASIGQMSNLRQGLLQQANQVHQYRHDPVQTVKAKRMRRLLSGRNLQTLTSAQVDEIFPDDYSDLLVDIDSVSHLATIFVAHRHKLLEALERNTPGKTKDGADLGPAPWEVVNESLRAAGFPYEAISPQDTSIVDTYTLRLRDSVNGTVLNPHDLSSGEQVLLQVVLWLYGASKDGVFPKLLLLDEPDAHLHPSMTVQFLDVISEVLVNRYGVRVILTTHSPSTVALAPEGSIFQMERGSKLIVPVEDRADTIGILTSGLLTVSRATKFCFVEDEDDVLFYEAVRDILSDYGPSKDPHALAASPSLAFIAASIGKGSQKISGGSSVVKKWVEKLDAEPLTRTFIGLLDKDAGNGPTDRIRVIGRYSFENYLLDPVNVFGLLLEDGAAPKIPGLTITTGDEHRLRGLSEAALQLISDAVTDAVESAEIGLKGPTRALISYTTGQKINVPEWVLSHRGHDLLPAVQRVWGGPQRINPPRLIKALRRTRLLPTDLVSVLADLQSI
jgi:predicted ATPase